MLVSVFLSWQPLLKSRSQYICLLRVGDAHLSAMPGVAVVGRSMTPVPPPGVSALTASRDAGRLHSPQPIPNVF